MTTIAPHVDSRSIEHLDHEPDCADCHANPARFACLSHGHGVRLRCARCTRRRVRELQDLLDEWGWFRCTLCPGGFCHVGEFLTIEAL